MQESMVPIYRISTSLGETFRYDSVHLRKVNFDTANIMLMVCGRNRMTTQSQPIACLTVPLTCCGKVSAPQWFPLVYRIMLPSGHDVEIHQPLSLTKSWDQQGTYLYHIANKILYSDLNAQARVVLGQTCRPHRIG